MLFPFDTPACGRDWNPLNGTHLVDAIDQLYREAVDHSIEWHAQHVGGWGTARDRENLKRRFGDKWWFAYGPVVGMLTPGRAEIPDLPPGRDYQLHWSERQITLHKVFAQALSELRSGGIVVQADGDHTVEFQPVVVPVGFWRAANWILYRASPHDHALPQLVALDADGDEIPPTYYNPRVIVPGPASSLRAESAIAPAMAVSTAKRADPRNKSADMVRGLELALQRGTIRPGMAQTALHVAMLDALEIPRDATPRGFEYDAFRKHCRPWLIEHRFVHENKR